MNWLNIPKTYKSNIIPLLLNCKICNHIFRNSFNNINCKDQGCPYCSSYKSEKVCRKYFEDKFKVHFEKVYPEWLQGLELDGYNEKLKLAFEYNGIQHYKIDGFFNKNNEDLQKIIARDKIKRKILKQKDIQLITIPYKYNYLKEDKLFKFIEDCLSKSIHKQVYGKNGTCGTLKAIE